MNRMLLRELSYQIGKGLYKMELFFKASIVHHIANRVAYIYIYIHLSGNLVNTEKVRKLFLCTHWHVSLLPLRHTELGV